MTTRGVKKSCNYLIFLNRITLSRENSWAKQKSRSSQRYFRCLLYMLWTFALFVFFSSLDRKLRKQAMSQTRTEKGNQEFLVPSLSGDKAFSSRENNVRASENVLFLSDGREGGDEQAGEYLLADSASRAGAERTAEVSYWRLSAGESRGLVTAKKAKERRRRRRKKKKRRNDGRAGEKNCAPRAKRPSDFIAARGKEWSLHIVDYRPHLKCAFKL